jgi:hypothetical protein
LHDNDWLKGIIHFVDRDKGPLLIALSRFLLEVWQIWEKDQSRQQYIVSLWPYRVLYTIVHA